MGVPNADTKFIPISPQIVSQQQSAGKLAGFTVNRKDSSQFSKYLKTTLKIVVFVGKVFVAIVAAALLIKSAVAAPVHFAIGAGVLIVGTGLLYLFRSAVKNFKEKSTNAKPPALTMPLIKDPVVENFKPIPPGELAVKLGQSGKMISDEGGASGGAVYNMGDGSVIKFIPGSSRDEGQTRALNELAGEYHISYEMRDLLEFVKISKIEPHVTPGGIVGVLVEMPLLEGVTVSKLIDENPSEKDFDKVEVVRFQLVPSEKAKVIAKSANALASAIERGVFPFDVNAQNIMITDEGPKFFDYGYYRTTENANTYSLSDYLMHYWQLFLQIDSINQKDFSDYLSSHTISELSNPLQNVMPQDEEGRKVLIAALHTISDHFNTI